MEMIGFMTFFLVVIVIWCLIVLHYVSMVSSNNSFENPKLQFNG